MKKNYLLLILSLFAFNLYAQEVLTFSGYNGTAINLTANTSTVNDDITIVFEDLNVLENFYTESQDEIYMYAGLTTNSGSFQFAPSFNDLAAQPILTLVDSDVDNSAGPNTYSITINLSQHFSSVPLGTSVLGLNLLFQNQFNDGGNNQTIDLYIDLVDDVTLGIQDFSNVPSVRIIQSQLITQNYQGELSISVYDLSGRLTNSIVASITSQNFRTLLDLPKNQMNIIVVEGSSFSKTFKVISK